MSTTDKGRQQAVAAEEEGGQAAGPDLQGQLADAVAAEREMLHRLECEIRR